MTLPKPPAPLGLDVANLTVTVKNKRLVHNVTFSVPPGGALSIAGPVGAGKSALLWAMNGLLAEVPGAHTSGSITIGGVPTQQVPPTELRRRVGLLITAPLARTPFAEVAIALQGSPAAQAGNQVEQALRLVGLWRMLRDRLHQLYDHSDLVLLRLLTLARTVALQPGLLLLDDPTRGLDSMGRARFEDAVASIVSTGQTTLVWSTREPDQAGRVANQMAFLCAGEIVEMGAVEKLFERPADLRTESFLTGDYKQLLSLVNARESGGKEETK